MPIENTFIFSRTLIPEIFQLLAFVCRTIAFAQETTLLLRITSIEGFIVKMDIFGAPVVSGASLQCFTMRSSTNAVVSLVTTL